MVAKEKEETNNSTAAEAEAAAAAAAAVLTTKSSSVDQDSTAAAAAAEEGEKKLARNTAHAGSSPADSAGAAAVKSEIKKDSVDDKISVKGEQISKEEKSDSDSGSAVAVAAVGSENAEITLELLERSIRGFLTEETAAQFTKRTIREKLAVELKVKTESLNEMRDEINSIVQNVLEEITSAANKRDTPTPAAATPTTTEKKRSPSSTEDTNDGSSSSKSKSGGSSAKRVKTAAASEEENEKGSSKKLAAAKKQQETDETAAAAEESSSSSSSSSDAAASSSSSDEDDESSYDEEEEEKSKKKPKAKSMKAVQKSLMTKQFFLQHAKSFACQIGELKFKLEPRKFNTGSCGWYFGGKYPLPVSDKSVICSIGLNCAVVGSKDWVEGSSKKRKGGSS